MAISIATFISLVPLLTALLAMPIQAYKFFTAPAPGTIANPLPTDTYAIVEYLHEIKLPDSNSPIYNGCILRDPVNSSSYLLSYRQTENSYTDKLNEVTGLLTLDQSWRITRQQVIDLKTEYNMLHAGRSAINQPEDMRLFTFDGKLYAIYNAIFNALPTDMFIASLKRNGQQYTAANITRLHFQASIRSCEKNWSPFIYDNKVYFVYTSVPRTIFSFDPKDDNIKFAYETFDKVQEQNYNWQYGEIKGGTPAEYIPELDAYLTFFHSNLPYKHGELGWEIMKEPHWRIYYMGAYVFEAKPPFRILAITTKPLTYKGLYQDKNKNYHIIFPTGFVTTQNDFIISVGIDDKELALLKINKQHLYKNLTWFMRD